MLVKLVNGSKSDTGGCDNIVVTNLVDKIQIEMVKASKVVRTINLPDDGNTVYVMNDGGDTIDTYRWPREKAA